jgi:hypothetical protein
MRIGQVFGSVLELVLLATQIESASISRPRIQPSLSRATHQPSGRASNCVRVWE